MQDLIIISPTFLQALLPPGLHRVQIKRNKQRKIGIVLEVQSYILSMHSSILDHVVGLVNTLTEKGYGKPPPPPPPH